MEIKNFIPQRFEKLNNLMNNGEAMLLFANNIADVTSGLHFNQDNNFLYFTGLELPNARLFALKSNNALNVFLFIERNIPERIVWEGAKMYPQEATEISSIKNVKYTDEMDRVISTYAPMISKLYVNYGNVSVDMPMNEKLIYATKLKQRNLNMNVCEVTEIVKYLRQIHDDFEIEQMTTAIKTTGAGLQDIFTKTKPGMYEFELEAMLNYQVLSRGHRHMGFTSIIASDINSTTLHYEENNCMIEDNSVCLCDVGSACYGYSADISRTFPTGQTFTKRQREVYQAVLDVQHACIDFIKPGITWKEYNGKANDLIAEACIKLGLITEKKDFRRYYMHSIGHFLGLECHDVGDYNGEFKPGMVVTCEPGIYIPEEHIGVRIEDDILVTEEGNKVLSYMIPKEISDLEALRS